jgi:hypothetical protein
MAEYSRMAKGSFTSTGSAKVIYLPFQPDHVRFVNYTSSTTPATNGIPHAYWDSGMGQGFAAVDIFNATPVLTTSIVASNGISTFSAGLMFQFGAQIQIASITKASPAVVTTASAHGYSTGDIVLLEGLYQTSTTGMPQISGIPFVVTVTGATTFTIPWNTNQSNYTALSGSPAGAYVMKVLFPFLYAPGWSTISAITLGTTTTVTTTLPHNLVVGQEVAFRIPSVWGTTQLNTLPNSSIPGSPIYYLVTSVASSTQFVCNAVSSSFTAFASNPTVAQTPGLSFPQVIPIGDINSGGVAYSGGALYPSPVVSGASTINGPAISGSFVNNTRQGFLIGAGAATGFASSSLVGANNDVIYWEAILSDFASP